MDQFTEWTLALIGLSDVAERWPEVFRKAAATAAGMVAAALVTWLAAGSYGFASTVYENDNEIAAIRAEIADYKEKAANRCGSVRDGLRMTRERLHEIATQMNVNAAILRRLERRYDRLDNRQRESGQ